MQRCKDCRFWVQHPYYRGEGFGTYYKGKKVCGLLVDPAPKGSSEILNDGHADEASFLLTQADFGCTRGEK